MGEAYVVMAPPQFVVVSRRMGSEWQVASHELTEIEDCRLEGEEWDLYLAWSVADREYVLPIPSRDRDEAEELCALWLHSRQQAGKDLRKRATKPARPKVVAIPEELTPVLALSAALQAMLMADEKAADEEWQLVQRLIERPITIEQGAALLRSLGVDGFLKRLEGVLSEPQKQCVLANLYELAMVDGHLRASEVTLLDKFRQTLGMDREQCAQLEQVLRTKNDLSVFSY
jgi:uncharacterized tellurite resistance protein B-like protein